MILVFANFKKEGIKNENKSIFIAINLFNFYLSFFTGCSSSRGIEDKAYAIALGIDTSDTHDVKISIQFAVLNSSLNLQVLHLVVLLVMNSTILSVDCSSIDSGISLINSYISKQVNLSHCKAVIISGKNTPLLVFLM